MPTITLTKTERIDVRASASIKQLPIMILARLAVDRNHQGMGLGAALLKDALLRTLQAAEIVGIRTFLVHAKDDAARSWYEGWDLS